MVKTNEVSLDQVKVGLLAFICGQHDYKKKLVKKRTGTFPGGGLKYIGSHFD